MFSTEGDPVGIQVGTAISTLVRKGDHTPAAAVGFRHLWGRSKRADPLASAEAGPAALYESIAPTLPLSLPFMQTTVDDGWFDWPALPDLFPTSFPGGQTGRDGFLVDSDLDRLKARIGNYFDPNLRKDAVEPQSAFTRCMGARHLIERGANWFPAWLREDTGRRPNLTDAARRYLDRMGAGAEDLFHHVLATLHDPAYREANAGALRMEWSRIPLPDAAQDLAESAARGREIAALLDPETPVPSVTQAPLRPGLAAIAVPATTADRNMTGADFALTAGWGHLGAGGAVMPDQGRVMEHRSVFDVHLNDDAFWRDVPAAVWRYRLCGYQMLKKWLSYRERPILGRDLPPEEVQHFTDTARRIAALLAVSSERGP